MHSKFYLLELLQQQEEIIEKQNEAIASLVNETVEQECIIDELTKNLLE